MLFFILDLINFQSVSAQIIQVVRTFQNDHEIITTKARKPFSLYDRLFEKHSLL
jgi:hypothetical protein